MERQRLKFFYAGTVIVLSLLIGGGTTQGLWSDHLLELFLIPALFVGLVNYNSSRLGKAAWIWVVLLIIILVMQFIPVGRDLVVSGDDFVITTSLFSAAPGKSLESALFAITVLGFALFVSQFSDVELNGLLWFFIVGFIINLLVGLLQLSFSGEVAIEGMLPYIMKLGAFANSNHFSTLVFVMIPILAYYFLCGPFRVVRYLVVVVLIIGFLFAVGSRAGMIISLMLAPFCLIWFGLPKTESTKKLALFAVISVFPVLMFYWLDGLNFLQDKGDLRLQYFMTTVKAITDHWIAGTGLGTFVLIYPIYEDSGEIMSVYANHAHNDFIEFFLETGVVGAVLIIGYITMSIKNFSRTNLSQAAFIGITALLTHSLVDYPLRTMAMAITFAYLSAIVFATKNSVNTDKY